MFKRKTTEDFEKGKLFLYETRPFATSEKGTIDNYHYYGRLKFDSLRESAVSPFPELVKFEDDDNKLTYGLTLREIYDQNKNNNRFLLKNHLMSMPNGFNFTDPCYIRAHEEGERPNDPEPVFPAGDWEVTIKGSLVASSRSVDAMTNISEEKMEVVEGFIADYYYPRATSCWVVKPGAEFVAISERPVGGLGVDSGLAGVFPVDETNSYTWNEFLSELRHLERNPKFGANVSQYGVYANTTYGDGGYNIYELLDANGNGVGYVCSYNGNISSEVLGTGRTKEEVLAIAEGYRSDLDEEDNFPDVMEHKDFLKKNVEMKEKLGEGVKFEYELDNLDYPVKAYGTVSGSSLPKKVNGELHDDMLFYFYRLPNMKYSLRIGMIDYEYRAKTEKAYVDQEIMLDSKPYLPTWDDNYPDKKIFEATTDFSYFSDYVIQEAFLSLFQNIEEVPEDKALFI